MWCCSGDIKYEPGAVVCRMAHSWVRFGSFQLPAALEENDLVKQLADYVIKHHYSHLQGTKYFCCSNCLLLSLCCNTEYFWQVCLFHHSFAKASALFHLLSTNTALFLSVHGLSSQ